MGAHLPNSNQSVRLFPYPHTWRKKDFRRISIPARQGNG
jgi:hypothetical protein